LLAAALYAFAVLPIQQSHFMTVDTFTNTFGLLTVYLGVVVLTRSSLLYSGKGPPTARIGFGQWFPYAAFGLALGMAAASKINAVSLALLLPAVEAVRFARLKPEEREVYGKFSLKMILLAALVSLLSFRVFQPYAFSGTSFFTLGLNREWLDGLKSLAQQSTGNVDFPPALQWARRSVGFSLTNLVVWGLGIPFGVFSLLSLAAMGWAELSRESHAFTCLGLDVVLPSLAVDGLGKGHALLAAHLPVVSRDCSLGNRQSLASPPRPSVQAFQALLKNAAQSGHCARGPDRFGDRSLCLRLHADLHAAAYARCRDDLDL
jgi:4-amino-4-deoxy-L-arabinose transferase-like glycosyltransferase